VEKTLLLGKRCNNNCFLCEFKHLEKEKTTDEVFTELDIFKSKGVSKVIFKGGEPTLREDMTDIIRKAKDLGLEVVLVSNGRSFYYKGVVNKFIDAGVDKFIIHFWGDEDFHDNLTKVKGSYRQTMQGINNIRESCRNILVNLIMINDLSSNIVAHYREFFRGKMIDFKSSRQQYSVLDQDDYQELLSKLKKLDIDTSGNRMVAIEKLEKFHSELLKTVKNRYREYKTNNDFMKQRNFLERLIAVLENEKKEIGKLKKNKTIERTRIFDDILSYYLTIPLNTPDRISIATSSSCNLRCRDCDSWKSKRIKDKLSKEDFKDIIDKASLWSQKTTLVFCGPEPLIDKNDLFELIRHATKKGLKSGLVTNGTLIDEKTAKTLIELKLDYIVISLDGARPKTHDFIKGTEGSFNKVIRALEHLVRSKKEKNVKTTIAVSAVVNNTNLDELIDFVHMLERMGVDTVDFNPYLQNNSFMNHKRYDKDIFWIPKSRISRLKEVSDKLISLKKSGLNIDIIRSDRRLRLMLLYFEKQKSFQKEMVGLCSSGYRYFNIDRTGVVSVCEKGPNLNVKNMPLSEIWLSHAFWLTRLYAKLCDVGCIDGCYEKYNLVDMSEV